jgi:hypothetical protein
MALDDYFESEVGIAIAATAVVLSPGARNFVRRGIVYALAGVFKARDAVTSAARGTTAQVANVTTPSPNAKATPAEPAVVGGGRGARRERRTVTPGEERAPS